MNRKSLGSPTYQNIFSGELSSSNHTVMPKSERMWVLNLTHSFFFFWQNPISISSSHKLPWSILFPEIIFPLLQFHRCEPLSENHDFFFPQMWSCCDSHPTSAHVRTCPLISTHGTTLIIISSQFVKKFVPFIFTPCLWLPSNLGLQAQAGICFFVLLPTNSWCHTKYKHVTTIKTIFKMS